MALRVLTDTERQTLADSLTFKNNCKWAARNYSEFVAQPSEPELTSASTNTQKKKAVKDIIVATEIIINDTADNNISIRFLNASKGKEFDVAAANLSEAALLTAWSVANAYGEFVPAYFDILGEPMKTSII